jgi:hypothetical protein
VARPATWLFPGRDPLLPVTARQLCCGGRMIVVETFDASCQPRHVPTLRIDTS